MEFHSPQFRAAYARAMPGRDPHADVRNTTAPFVKQGMAVYEAETRAREMAIGAAMAAHPAESTDARLRAARAE